MDKQNKLQKLQKKIDDCNECKRNTIGKMVFGEGSVDAQVMFVGEAPGKQEAESGRPFIGRSGQLLRSLIRSIGLKEKDVYITSPIKYLPKHGTPKKEEMVHSRKHFDKQIEIIDPKIIVLLGKTAIFTILDEDMPILKNHGDVRKKNSRTYLVTLHPAAVLRFPKYRSMIEEDFMRLKEIVKRRT